MKRILNFLKKLFQISSILNGKTVNVIIDVSGSINISWRKLFYSYVKLLLRVGKHVNLVLVDNFIQKTYHLKNVSDLSLISIDVGQAGDGVQKGLDYIALHNLSMNNTVLFTDGYTYPSLSLDAVPGKLLILNTLKESPIKSDYKNVKQKIIKL